MVVGADPIRQGDIWLVDFSPVLGREQSGRRPALILSRNEHNAHSGVITVAPLTSSMTMQNHPAAVHLPASPLGARVDSLILVFQLRTIDKIRLERRLYSAPKDIMERIWRAIEGHFALNK